jgi:hypothetical protein
MLGTRKGYICPFITFNSLDQTKVICKILCKFPCFSPVVHDGIVQNEFNKSTGFLEKFIRAH